jgi:homeodomain-containing protein
MLVFMSQHLHVHLYDEQRQHLDNLIRKGNAPARLQTRARILLLSDRSSGQRRSRKAVADAALVCPVTVGRVCRTFASEGLEAALCDKPRPGREPKITGDLEARLVALACSDPPQGTGRWTLQLLADTMVALGYLESISDVAIGKRLKKTRSSPGR